MAADNKQFNPFEGFDDEDLIPPPDQKDGLPAYAMVDASTDPQETPLNAPDADPDAFPEEIDRLPIRLRPHMWGSLIMGMLVDPDNADSVLANHHTTAAETRQLLDTNENFKIAVREVKSRIKAHGPNAGFVLRSQALAEEFLQDMYLLMRNPNTVPAIKLRTMENLVSWGRLDPKLDKDKSDAINTGVHFTMNFVGGSGRYGVQGIAAVESTGDEPLIREKK